MSHFLGRDTQYGFQWGPATIERTADFKERIVLTLRTSAGKDFDIYVSAQGRSVRIFDKDGTEWKPSK